MLEKKKKDPPQAQIFPSPMSVLCAHKESSWNCAAQRECALSGQEHEYYAGLHPLFALSNIKLKIQTPVTEK